MCAKRSKKTKLAWVNAKTCQVLKCVQQGASSVHVRCMTNAWAGKMYKTHNQWSKHDKHEHLWWSPKFGTHWSLKQRENVIWAFYQIFRVHTLHMYVKQCINIWKSCLNTCYFCHNGPTSKTNCHLKQNPIKKIYKK